MHILAIYTHLNHVHIYFAQAGNVYFDDQYLYDERALSTELPLLIKDCIQFQTPHCIALHNGPGAFTGLRVTLAFIQGLCTGLNIPLYTCSHFEVLKDAYAIENGCIVIDSKSKILSAVTINNAIISAPYQCERKNIQSSDIYPKINSSINLAKTLYYRALNAPHSWIEPNAIKPNYCFLPIYQKSETIITPINKM